MVGKVGKRWEEGKGKKWGSLYTLFKVSKILVTTTTIIILIIIQFASGVRKNIIQEILINIMFYAIF